MQKLFVMDSAHYKISLIGGLATNSFSPFFMGICEIPGVNQLCLSPEIFDCKIS